MMLLSGFVLGFLCLSSAVTGKTGPEELAKYDYGDALKKSILFFEAQRSGKLPSNNRIPYRGDSAMGDRGHQGQDLTGGWYDAGDCVKFNFPMAGSTTLLAWSLLEYRSTYQAAGQLDHMLSSIKWPLDYFVKCHTSRNELYGQVGDGHKDHSWWGRPEDMTMERPSFKLTTSKPGSDLAGETAAALAAGALAFQPTDRGYADRLTEHAKQIYEFAENHRGKYSDSITQARDFYGSNGYMDELAWGAAWLYKLTRDAKYLQKAEQYLENKVAWALSWDEKHAGATLLLYQLTRNSKYKTSTEQYMKQWLRGGSIPYTPKGLAWRSKWGSNRYAANTAFLALVAADAGIQTGSYRAFAISQIHYMLGDHGRSLVCGFGNNPPKRPHHSASSCPNRPARCDWNDFNRDADNPQVLYGALVGGPGRWDEYKDDRKDYVMNEVACDYNAGYQGALAGLKKLSLE